MSIRPTKIWRTEPTFCSARTARRPSATLSPITGHTPPGTRRTTTSARSAARRSSISGKKWKAPTPPPAPSRASERSDAASAAWKRKKKPKRRATPRTICGLLHRGDTIKNARSAKRKSIAGTMSTYTSRARIGKITYAGFVTRRMDGCVMVRRRSRKLPARESCTTATAAAMT